MIHHKSTLLLLLLTFAIAPWSRLQAEDIEPSEKTRLQWVKKASLVKKGMSWPQVKKVLPNYGGTAIFGEGGGYVVAYLLDENWTVSIGFKNATKKVISGARVTPAWRPRRPFSFTK